MREAAAFGQAMTAAADARIRGIPPCCRDLRLNFLAYVENPPAMSANSDDIGEVPSEVADVCSGRGERQG
ncbi:hypothetical protein ADL12_02230 [Streptomyces regalis]|uniref:Uncharacterized protein n=1 Tax=Streptomyces regalis TaxID=68262 RepID=A0A0X3VP33_9ACTN|nr:hypothetical protein ADL12_02230 [Streptomyces regalis]